MGPKSKTSAFILGHINYSADDCLFWPYGRDGQGYARAKVKGFNTRLAHRIMCEMAHGSPGFDRAVARHLCGNGHKGCVNPTHLAWGTVADNNKDKCDAGNQPVGEASGNAVLSEQIVRTIRVLKANGHSQAKIASHFGVCRGTIQAVWEGRTWRHVS